MEEKNIIEQLTEELTYAPKHICKIAEQEEIETADAFCEGYKKYLNDCKTERESVEYFVANAKSLSSCAGTAIIAPVP